MQAPCQALGLVLWGDLGNLTTDIRAKRAPSCCLHLILGHATASLSSVCSVDAAQAQNHGNAIGTETGTLDLAHRAASLSTMSWDNGPLLKSASAKAKGVLPRCCRAFVVERPCNM